MLGDFEAKRNFYFLPSPPLFKKRSRATAVLLRTHYFYGISEWYFKYTYSIAEFFILTLWPSDQRAAARWVLHT